MRLKTSNCAICIDNNSVLEHWHWQAERFTPIILTLVYIQYTLDIDAGWNVLDIFTTSFLSTLVLLPTSVVKI